MQVYKNALNYIIIFMIKNVCCNKGGNDLKKISFYLRWTSLAKWHNIKSKGLKIQSHL